MKLSKLIFLIYYETLQREKLNKVDVVSCY